MRFCSVGSQGWGGCVEQTTLNKYRLWGTPLNSQPQPLCYNKIGGMLCGDFYAIRSMT